MPEQDESPIQRQYTALTGGTRIDAETEVLEVNVTIEQGEDGEYYFAMENPFELDDEWRHPSVSGLFQKLTYELEDRL